MPGATEAGPPDVQAPLYLGRVLGPGGAVGTCFQVTRGVLVTACHVLDGLGAAAEGAALRIDPLAGGEAREARVLRLDPVHDLAVITADPPLPAVAGPLGKTSHVKPRENVSATAHGVVRDRHDYRFLEVQGEWSGATMRDGLMLGCMTASRVLPGMSGAPVIRDRDRSVIGVISSRYNSADGWLAGNVWVARTEDLRPLLAKIADVSLASDAATIGLDELGVRRSRTDIDTGGDPFYRYVKRDRDTELDVALNERSAGKDARMLLLTGDAMAGKSRVLAEAVRRNPELRGWTLIRPPAQAPLEHAIDLAGKTSVLLWLDDLDRYLPAISRDQLRDLLGHRGIAVLATIRTDHLTRLSHRGPRTEWEIVSDDKLTHMIKLPTALSERELFPPGQPPLRDREPVLREAIDHGKPFGVPIAAGTEMLLALAVADDDQRALADLLADWPRTGIAVPLPDADAMRLWRSYLPPAQARGLASLSAADQRRRYEQARDWLCEPVHGSRTPIAWRTDDGLDIDDLFKEQRSSHEKPPPAEVFGCALAVAAMARDPRLVMLAIASEAADAGYPSVAGYAAGPPVDDPGASKLRSIVYGFTQGTGRVFVDARKKVRAGSTVSVRVVGHTIKPAEIEGARAYAECSITWRHLDPQIVTIPVVDIPVPLLHTENAYTRVKTAVQEFRTPGAVPAYYAFAELARIHIPDNAAGRVNTANIEIKWRMEAEVIAQKGKMVNSVPIEVTPRVPRQAPAAPVVTGGNAVALAFSGLPGGSIYPSDQLTGCLLLRAEHDFLAPEISIYLQLRSSVHWPTGFTSRYKYHVLTRDEPLRLHANQPAELPFSCLVPGRLPAPSIKSYDPGEAAHNLAGAWTAARLNAVARRFRSKFSSAKGMLSTEWYLVARVKRQVGPAIKIRQNIIIVYP